VPLDLKICIRHRCCVFWGNVFFKNPPFGPTNMQSNSHLGRFICVFFLKQNQENYNSPNTYKKWKNAPTMIAKWSQSDPPMTPKGVPMDPQRRQMEPNDAPEAPRWFPKGDKWSPRAQWPSKCTQGIPRVPKDHWRQAQRARWSLKLKKLR